MPTEQLEREHLSAEEHRGGRVELFAAVAVAWLSAFDHHQDVPAALMPSWVLERHDSPWFDASPASSPALRAAGDEIVTAWLVAMGSFLAWRAHTAVDVNLPTLAAFRRAESGRFLRAAARRLGVA